MPEPGLEPVGYIAALLTADGSPAGVGFLAERDVILTCAHVVNVALGRDDRSQEMPESAVAVAFPLLEGSGGPAISAQIERWLPPPRVGAAGDDIALLRLTGAPPSGAVPASLATTQPRAGQVVDVFGYPQTPRRSGGGWVPALVRGPVAGGRLQLDAAPGAALQIQPGYSGGPVRDRESGRVIGMVAAAPAAGSVRDAYAIGVAHLLSAWPDALDPEGRTLQRLTGQRISESEVTVLHVSDALFGYDTSGALFGPLHADIETLADDPGLRPDLAIVTGDLTRRGVPSEFRHALRFLTELTEVTGLPRRHVALVPGNRDVNRAACEAYFVAQRAREQDPLPPYWPKWESFVALFDEFYAGVAGASFTPDEPWSLFEMPDLRVAVAGLDSTIADSHRDGDHYGHVGEGQLRWFATRLAEARRQGWLRLAAVHHNVLRSGPDEEQLHDVEDLDRLLGDPSLAHLLPHGHTHDARLHHLASGLAAASTGHPAIADGSGSTHGPYQYQIITIRPDGLTRYARVFAADRNRWVGDNRVSRTGSAWQETFTYPLTDVQAAFPGDDEERAGADARADVAPLAGPAREPDDDLLERVAEATRVSYPDASVTRRTDAGYLRVSGPLPGGGSLQWPVGVIDTPDEARVREFITRVHSRFAAADPQLRSELVYARGPASDAVIATGQVRHVLSGHSAPVNAAAFSPPDGALIVTVSDDKTARVWEAATGQLRAGLAGHTREVSGGGVLSGWSQDRHCL
jgi:3',5'-cyclic AMP phosphodiesterase CpdA